MRQGDISETRNNFEIVALQMLFLGLFVFSLEFALPAVI